MELQLLHVTCCVVPVVPFPLYISTYHMCSRHVLLHTAVVSKIDMKEGAPEIMKVCACDHADSEYY